MNLLLEIVQFLLQDRLDCWLRLLRSASLITWFIVFWKLFKG